MVFVFSFFVVMRVWILLLCVVVGGIRGSLILLTSSQEAGNVLTLSTKRRLVDQVQELHFPTECANVVIFLCVVDGWQLRPHRSG